MVLDSKRRLVYKLEGATKAYNGKDALAPLTLRIEEGEAVAIVGPSGSGKTTLLHLLAGVIKPDAGSIDLNGRNLSELQPGRELSSLVGVIHQQFDLVPHLSVLHNVLAGRLGEWSTIRSLLSLIWPRERGTALKALERVGIPDKIGERASRLSGGEQQRVAIARLLVQNPKIIIADEPVSSLDPARASDLLGMLSSIAQESGKTLIASIHTIELARKNFSRVIGLRNGRLWFDLPVESITNDILDALYEIEGLEVEGVGQV